MKILGLDPGFQRLGVAILEVKDGKPLLKDVACLYNPSRGTEPYNEYLNTGIQQLVNDYPKLLDLARPDLIISEIVPVGRLGSNTELVVAGITTCKVISFQFGIDWKDVAANTVKKELTGNHKASKAVVKNAVFAEYPALEERHKLIKAQQKKEGEKAEGLPQDVFDAVAIAVVGWRVYEKENGLNANGLHGGFEASHPEGSVQKLPDLSAVRS